MAFVRNSSRGFLIILYCLTALTVVESLQISYCSSQNTGSAQGPYFWPYQSNGWCQDQCKATYAYAVLQGNNCWCSNYAPSVQLDYSQCAVPCPGYKTEQCGNQAQSLYGYYHLDIEPSGTVPAPSQSPSQSQISLPDPITVTATVQDTVTMSIRHTTSTTAPMTTTNAPQTTYIATPTTIITTVQGSVQYITVTPSIPASDGQSAQVTSASDPFWSDQAKVAGVFTVVALVIVALIVAAVYFLWWRRKKSSESMAIASISDHDGHSTLAGGFYAPNEKRNSRHGLGSGGRGGSNERTPTMATPVSMSRRHSQPLVHDQRLNPNALYAMGQENDSRASMRSLQDDQDYSRPVLAVRNPDSED